ncbi:MAG: rod shape-determining protein MreC [Clostridiales bacterium]|nr:rod shape-determining protein MreC [Candidatus Cacconaster stercorequi]
MKNFFSKTGIWLLAAAAVIAVALCVLSAVSSNSSFLHNAAGVVTSPFRAAGSAVSGWVGGISDRFEKVEKLQEENRELRKQLSQLQETVRQGKVDSEENQRLRKLLNLSKQRRDFTFESANITERSTSNWASTMTLSKGTAQDVAVGNCVVSDEGYLVGVVSEVGLNWCTVTTVLDTDCQIGAKVFRTGEVAVAMGDLGLMAENRLKLSYLQGSSSLIGGDQVLTSGLGGYYPSGLVIGSVEELKTDDNGLTKYGVLIPQVDLNALKEVFIITSFDIVT